MATYPIVSRPFPRGRTTRGEEIVILTWRDLEFFSQMQVKGEWYRTYCPIYGSEQERSLTIKIATGFGHCSERVKHQLAWDGGVRVEMCRPTRGNNWSERWRREGDGGLELLYVHHALLTHCL